MHLFEHRSDIYSSTRGLIDRVVSGENAVLGSSQSVRNSSPGTALISVS